MHPRVSTKRVRWLSTSAIQHDTHQCMHQLELHMLEGLTKLARADASLLEYECNELWRQFLPGCVATPGKLLFRC